MKTTLEKVNDEISHISGTKTKQDSFDYSTVAHRTRANFSVKLSINEVHVWPQFGTVNVNQLEPSFLYAAKPRHSRVGDVTTPCAYK